MKKRTSILVLLFLLSTVGYGQRYGKNYPRFDYKKLHFGFALGINTADFHYKLNVDTAYTDSLTSIDIQKQPGFNLGIISSWDINEVIHLRFVPSLSFQERLFTYQLRESGELKTLDNRIESTFLDFPLMLKLRTKRINNFAAYALGGFQYSLDLASQKDVNQSIGAPVVKVKQHDWAYQVGGGFDFWLPYFKFGLELKLSNGIKNLAIQDHTFFMDPIASLRSKVWWFSLTFEG